MSITYSECVFVACDIQDAMRMHHFIICGLLGSTIFSHTVSQTARLSKKVIEHKICGLNMSRNFVRILSHSKRK